MCGVSAMGSTPIGSFWVRSERSGRGFSRGGLTLQPRLEIRSGNGIDHDRHVAVPPPAKLGALAAVDARLVGIDLEPGLVDVAGDRVLLDAEVRHPPGVDDIHRGNE